MTMQLPRAYYIQNSLPLTCAAKVCVCVCVCVCVRVCVCVCVCV